MSINTLQELADEAKRLLLVPIRRVKDGETYLVELAAANHAIDALLSLDQASHARTDGGTQWQPIETAPKDGRVIMYCDEDGNRWLDCTPGHPGNSFGKRPQMWMPLPEPPHGIASPAAKLKKD